MNSPHPPGSDPPVMRRRARPQALDLSEISLTKARKFLPDRSTPLVIEPAVDNVDLEDWARGEVDYLQSELLKAGAILFRGFETNLDVFEAVAGAVSKDLIRDYGDLPQEQGTDGVYHSTPYPEDQTIEFHNESSHLTSWPEKQFFMCVQPSSEGGTTPIVDCREIYRLLDPELRDKFHRKGLKYVRNFIPNLDVPWQTFFRTDDRAIVEEKCRASGARCVWKDGGRLQTENNAPGVIEHPKTGELSFFNQVQLHHISSLPEEYRESTLSMFSDEDLPRNVFYGDGTPISTEEMDQVRAAFSQALIEFPWEKGDLLMLDNMLVAHARKPFKGERKIVVAMADLWKAEDVRSRPEA